MDVDHVDQIISQWNHERPDVDVSAMAVIGRISRLNRLIAPRLAAAFAEHDLESWEFDVLATLVRNGPPNQMTPGDLLASTMVTSGAMTNRIDRLEQRGFVTRTKNPTDGRQVLVTLTPKGQKKIDAAIVDHARNETTIISGLAPKAQAELADLLRMLQLSITAQTADSET